MRLSLCKKLFFASVPTVLLLALVEALLRLTGAAEKCPTYKGQLLWECDPILYFKTRTTLPVADGINRRGFRGRDFGPKTPGTFRILALGDSCTFGVAGVDGLAFLVEPYPERLEHLAAGRIGPGKLEVLNGGVPGYNTYQGIMLLRTKLRGLHPDLVTVRYGWNDHLMSRESYSGTAFREPHNPIVRAVQDLLLHTALYPLSQRLGMELQLRIARVTPSKADLIPSQWKPNIPLPEYEYNLRRIAELARAQGARVWFLTAPDAFLTPELLQKYEALPDDAFARRLLKLEGIPSFRRMMEIHDAYNAAMRAVAAELHVPLIDMAQIYRDHANQRLFSMFDILHPTEEGHSLEAETLYARLVAEDLLPPHHP
jgi:lysophospholipase L1-like esterase